MSAEPTVAGPSGADRPRDGWARHADAAWAVIKRIHLGTRKPANWVQLFKFGVVGGSGYVVNLVVFAILAGPLDVHHISAAIGAFLVAVTNNFLWNRHWTFPITERHAAHQGLRFLTVSVAGLCVNLVILALLVDALALAELPAQAIAVAVAMPVNFIGNKLWTFA